MPTPTERVFNGRVEEGRCYLNMSFGKITPRARHFVINPGGAPERVAIDLLWPSFVLPESLAEKLGIDDVRWYQGPPGAGAPKHQMRGVARIAYVVYDDHGEIAWEGVADAAIGGGDNNPPSLGHGQLMRWKLSIDGPGGTFRVRFPPQVV